MADNTGATESWNMATETLKRLSRCLDMCSFYSQQGELIEWYHASFDLRRNLSPFISDTELKEINSEISKMPKNWTTKSQMGKTIVNPIYYSSVYVILDTLYLKFMKHMKEKGLLMPKSINPSAAVMDN